MSIKKWIRQTMPQMYLSKPKGYEGFESYFVHSMTESLAQIGNDI
jgi:hypothetical protein